MVEPTLPGKPKQTIAHQDCRCNTDCFPRPYVSHVSMCYREFWWGAAVCDALLEPRMLLVGRERINEANALLGTIYQNRYQFPEHNN